MKLTEFFQRSELTRTLWSLRREFLVVAALSMMVNLLMLVPSIYMLQVYDRVLTSFSQLTLLAVSLIALFLLAAMALAEWIRSGQLVRAGLRLDAALGTRVFQASFEAHRTQSPLASSRAFGDLLQMRQFLTGAGIFALLDAPWAPIYIAVTFFLHPVLGWVALLFVLVQAALAWFGHRRTIAPAEAATQAGAEANAYLHAKLRNGEVIETLGMVGNLRRRWRGRQAKFLARAGDAHAATNTVGAWSKFARYTQQALSLGAGALLVIHGELSPGAMIAGNLLISRALAPIDQLVGVWRSFAATHVAFLRLEELLAAFPAPATGGAGPEVSGEVALRNVTARAQRREKPILSDVSLALKAGTVLAVLGPSGSGKSTLARVVLGIWPQAEGEVLLDGQPVQGRDRALLGGALGYLPQDIELLDGTLAENISRFGEPDPTRVIEAAKTAGLHETLLRLPKGYDTPIGEAGELLSTGQRQRVALARAVYGQPALVVLDEPDAHLDDAGEKALVLALQQLKAQGRTVILITHRPGLVLLADEILLLQDGQVRAHGPRDAVLAMLLAGARPQPPRPDAAGALPQPA